MAVAKRLRKLVVSHLLVLKPQNSKTAKPYNRITAIILLGVLLHLPGSVVSRVRQDSLVLDKVFAYKRNFAEIPRYDTTNAYFRYNFNIVRRNVGLLFVPTMFYIAKGRRSYVGEVYGRATFTATDRMSLHRQAEISTIPHNSRAMSTINQYATPDLYGAAVFNGNILSPFQRGNRQFYRYRIRDNGDVCVYVTFKPKTKNTQLVAGYAIIDKYTGRIVRSRLHGEHDMIRFDVDVFMGQETTDNTLRPKRCDVTAQFKFVGNDIRTTFHAIYDCPTTLPDSIYESNDTSLMARLRPEPLLDAERETYNEYYAPKTDSEDHAEKVAAKQRTIAWSSIGDYLVTSHGTENNRGYINISPLVNPLYLSYSASHGLAYKMKIGAHYNFSTNSNITLTPDIGYNFKIKQLYFNVPLTFNYDQRRNGRIELLWANGNRIANSAALDILRDQRRDTVDFSSLGLEYFNDQLYQVAWCTQVTRGLSLRLGTVYHRRVAVNKDFLDATGTLSKYLSFAPFVTLTLQPTPNWPILTANYERSLKHVLNSNTEYERWEFDASFTKPLSRLRRLNLRLGGGFYTNHSTNYFVDFTNFHDNYIPNGWQGDWTGDFQLLNSAWYNASRYYLRANASYESPLLLLTRLPIVGRYIESESLYANALQIEHTRPYQEIGYSLTNRYFSIGIFASLLNGSFSEFGSKFTFELFRKW